MNAAKSPSHRQAVARLREFAREMEQRAAEVPEDEYLFLKTLSEEHLFEELVIALTVWRREHPGTTWDQVRQVLNEMYLATFAAEEEAGTSDSLP